MKGVIEEINTMISKIKELKKFYCGRRIKDMTLEEILISGAIQETVWKKCVPYYAVHTELLLMAMMNSHTTI